MEKSIDVLAQEEFKTIIETYLLPLIDVRGRLKLILAKTSNPELVSFVEKNNSYYIKFYPCIGTKEPAPYYCEVGTRSSKSVKKRLAEILRELMKVAEFNSYGGKIHRQRYYGKSLTYKNETMRLAFEIGMCSWLAGDSKSAITLQTAVYKMKEWAGKTYEGKKIPFGIVVDFETEANDSAVSYLRFLENDSSAVFTDGIFSGIKLDKEGNVISFITRETPAPSSDKRLFVPYQFCDIAKHCVGRSIGIIVMTDGEILLIRNRAVCFAKRGGKWVSFDWEVVCKRLSLYLSEQNNSNSFIAYERAKIIYETLIDVSFAHEGGCLAIIIRSADEKDITKIIKERIDLYHGAEEAKDISSESKEKIEILKYLLSDDNGITKSFYDLERPLRKEILSLDGATVVSPGGIFYCAGSIVSVSPGSSGGGRTAAAKNLSKLGVGIKISEDGYIEAYSRPIAQAEKGRMVLMFCIK